MIKIASPNLIIPFKAHNSSFIGEKEGPERNRMWSCDLGNILI